MLRWHGPCEATLSGERRVSGLGVPRDATAQRNAWCLRLPATGCRVEASRAVVVFDLLAGFSGPETAGVVSRWHDSRCSLLRLGTWWCGAYDKEACY